MIPDQTNMPRDEMKDEIGHVARRQRWSRLLTDQARTGKARQQSMCATVTRSVLGGCSLVFLGRAGKYFIRLLSDGPRGERCLASMLLWALECKVTCLSTVHAHSFQSQDGLKLPMVLVVFFHDRCHHVYTGYEHSC